MFFTRKIGNIATSSGAPYLREVAVNSLSGQYQTRFEMLSPHDRSQSLHPANLRTSQTQFDWIHNTNTFQRLRNLLTLDENWDGYGASRFLRPQVSRAFDLYSDIYNYYLSRSTNFSQLSPFIAPCSDGAILFEWAGRRFPSRELEIFVPSTMESPLEYLKCTDDAEEEGSFSSEGVIALLDWLFATES